MIADMAAISPMTSPTGLSQAWQYPEAIVAASPTWMDWTIDRRTARKTGIPQGLPYLTGFVMHAAIEAEAPA